MEDKEQYKFPFSGPFGYKAWTDKGDKDKNTYYIHDFVNDKMLIGDKLPTGEALAIEYCRVATIAWRLSRSNIIKKLQNTIPELFNDPFN